MKYLVLMFALMLTGCVKETKFGKCVGLGGPQDPKYTYKISTPNIVAGIVFVDTVVVPVVVVLDQLYCPVGEVP